MTGLGKSAAWCLLDSSYLARHTALGTCSVVDTASQSGAGQYIRAPLAFGRVLILVPDQRVIIIRRWLKIY